jgi:hypothetical protein
MSEAEIQCLKDNVDRPVEITTSEGEVLVARVLSVFQSEEHDEHELFYEVISSNRKHDYRRLETNGGYALDFRDIVTVRPLSSASQKAKNVC